MPHEIFPGHKLIGHHGGLIQFLFDHSQLFSWRLLYDLKFTIEGAKKHLKEQGVETSLPPQDPEKIAARAREEALGEIDDAVDKARAELARNHEKQLLGLRQELLAFQNQLSEED